MILLAQLAQGLDLERPIRMLEHGVAVVDASEYFKHACSFIGAVSVSLIGGKHAHQHVKKAHRAYKARKAQREG